MKGEGERCSKIVQIVPQDPARIRIARLAVSHGIDELLSRHILRPKGPLALPAPRLIPYLVQAAAASGSVHGPTGLAGLGLILRRTPWRQDFPLPSVRLRPRNHPRQSTLVLAPDPVHNGAGGGDGLAVRI